MCGCTKLQAKQITLTFSVQIYLEMDLGLAIQKTNVGSASLRCHACQFSGKTSNFDFFDKHFPKNGFWGQNLKNLSSDSESASSRYYLHQFSDKTNKFEFLEPNLPKSGFWGWDFKNLSLNLESTPSIYHVCQFSVKMDNF